MLRKEKKAQSPPQNESKKEPKKKKQNQKKKKQYAGVKLDKDGLPIYDQSLFPSFDVPEWLDAEQGWCVGSTYCTNYGGQGDTI
jgi:hypothetical protein